MTQNRPGSSPIDSHGPEKSQPGVGHRSDCYWVLEAALRPEEEELWSLFCHEEGATGAEVTAETVEQITIRHFYNSSPASGEDAPPEASFSRQEFLAKFAARYPEAGRPSRLELSAHPVEHWETAWRVHFKPLPIGRRLLICPPWETAEHAEGFQGGVETAVPSPEALRLKVVIDPGMGFGTGWHASTHLALLLIEDLFLDTPRESYPARMLDVGTGSGILAIAGALLGGVAVTALDIDRVALPEVRRNFALSGLPTPEALVHGSTDSIRTPFPMVTANIVAPVLLGLREDLLRLTAPGGYLMVSGILVTERERFLAGFLADDASKGFQLESERELGEWWGCRLRPRS